MSVRYQCVLADPPWHYQNYASKPGTVHSRARGSQKHYPTETIESLCGLHVSDIVEDRAVLFMWATWPLIEDAFTLIRAWGFTYKTLAWEWVKTNRIKGNYFMGMGNYTRSNTEPCLLAFRGKPLPVSVHNISSVMVSPKAEHSRKPDYQYEIVESLYPELSKVELFARRKRDGWVSWGNEIESDISFGGINAVDTP